jgi:hypothetical protein
VTTRTGQSGRSDPLHVVAVNRGGYPQRDTPEWAR